MAVSRWIPDTFWASPLLRPSPWGGRGQGSREPTAHPARLAQRAHPAHLVLGDHSPPATVLALAIALVHRGLRLAGGTTVAAAATAAATAVVVAAGG